MGWADRYIEKLQAGETVEFRPSGNSMTGIVNHRDLVVVAPIEGDLMVGDVVLCKVAGSQYLHIVKAIDGDRVQIGNNKGRINGWCNRTAIYGRMIENKGKATNQKAES